MIPESMIQSYQQAKRLIMVVVGFTVLLIGIIMIPMPGPGFPLILVALGILAAEFVWAKRLLRRFERTATYIKIKSSRKLRLFSFSKIKERCFNLFKRKQPQ
jgi:uncharacterized protein (TIGR02611 family)